MSDARGVNRLGPNGVLVVVGSGVVGEVRGGGAEDEEEQDREKKVGWDRMRQRRWRASHGRRDGGWRRKMEI